MTEIVETVAGAVVGAVVQESVPYVGAVAGAVAGAVVQERVSYVLGKRKERVPAGHNAERIEMALTRVGLAVERSAKLPITDISLIRRRMILTRAYDEAEHLLDRHKRQALQQDQEDTGVTLSSLTKGWIARAKKFFVLSGLVGLSGDGSGLSCSDVARFERVADLAEKFVKDVKYGISLRQRYTFRYPFVRHLLEGKTLRYKKERGSQYRRICIWPIPSEGRGVEVYLCYSHEDYRVMPRKFFDLNLVLRISESTDIIGIAISCFQQLAFQFNIATEYVIREIIELSNLQRISHSDDLPWEWRHNRFGQKTKWIRPDPICCTNKAVSSCVPPFGVPEPVISLRFHCYVSAVEYILPSPTDEVGTNSPPLFLIIYLRPHADLWSPQKIRIHFKGRIEYIDGSSIQHMEAIVRSKALDFLLRQPDEAKYEMYLAMAHGDGYMMLEKPSRKPTWVRKPDWRIQKVIDA